MTNYTITHQHFQGSTQVLQGSSNLNAYIHPSLFTFRTYNSLAAPFLRIPTLSTPLPLRSMRLTNAVEVKH